MERDGAGKRDLGEKSYAQNDRTGKRSNQGVDGRDLIEVIVKRRV